MASLKVYGRLNRNSSDSELKIVFIDRLIIFHHKRVDLYK